MDRPRILLDVDGVLADFVSAACDVLSRLTGRELRVDQLDQWDIMKALGVPKIIEDEAYRWFSAEGFCYSLKPYVGAREMVAELQTWADLYAVTAPLDGPHWAFERENWLEAHFNIPRRRVVSARDKSIVVGDALVDDKLSNLVEWRTRQSGMAVFWRNGGNRHDIWNGAAASTYPGLLHHLSMLRIDESSRAAAST